MNKTSGQNSNRVVEALKSLSTLAEDNEANKELKVKLVENVNDMQNAIERLQSDPFGVKEKIK